MQNTTLTLITCLALSSLVVGCGGGSSSSNDDNSNNTTKDNASYVTLNASTNEAFLDLASGHSVNKSDAWHIGYKKYRGFIVNSGISGTGSITGCTAKHYPQLYTAANKPIKAEFKKLTSENTLADFNAVNKSSCSDFKQDSLKTAIAMKDWLVANYTSGAPTFTAKAGNGWIVRSASKETAGKHAYAKVSVKTVTYKLSPAKRAIVLKSNLWDGSNAFGTDRTSPELDFSTERVYWDLEDNTKVTANDNWDLSIVKNGMSWDIQLNSSVSGTGKAAVGVLLKPLNSITDPTDTKQVYKYFVDGAKGALQTPGNYGPLEYGVYGQHKMTPNFSTYLFKDGSKIYKMQVLNNYGKDGKAASGNLYIRYQEIID